MAARRRPGGDTNEPEPADPLDDESETVQYIGLSVPAMLLSTTAVPMVAWWLVVVSGRSYRTLWIGTFAFNVFFVSAPGRLDDEMSRTTGADPVWRSPFSPAPWAFAIWGLIYMGELGISVAVAYDGAQQVYAARLFWVAATLYQCLWCLTFRRRFMKQMWLPTLNLGLGAMFMYGVHRELTSALNNASADSRMTTFFIRLPISLHLTWLSAATLLNLNGWAARVQVSIANQLLLANASAVLGFLLGAGYAMLSRDSAIGKTVHTNSAALRLNELFLALTMAWALTALADKTANSSDVDADQASLKALALRERVLAVLLVVCAGVLPFVPQADFVR